MEKAARREDSVEVSITELQEMERDRQKQLRIEEAWRRREAERQLAEAERKREQARLEAEAEEGRAAVAAAEQARLEAERALREGEADNARRAADARMAEAQLALDLERVRASAIDGPELRPRRNYLVGIAILLLFLSQLVLFSEQRASQQRNQALKIDLDRVAAERNAAVRELNRRLEAVRPQPPPWEVEPAASPATSATPAKPKPRPRPRPGSNGDDRSGPVTLGDCDVNSPLCN